MNIIEEIEEVITELNGLKSKYPKMETQAVIDLIGRLKDKVKKNVVLDNVSYDVAQQYAEFCVRCDREKLPLIKIEDYLKQL